MVQQATRPLVVGVFANPDDASRAYSWLLANGYGSDEINVVLSPETRERYRLFPEAQAQTDGSRTAGGVAAGAAVGATAAAIAAIGTAVLVPGVGWVAGPLLAALGGASAGAVTGGLIGGMMDLSIPESNAQEYDKAVKAGGVVLAVTPRDGDGASVRERFEAFRGEQIYAA